jgi:hypothetical protein
MLLEKAMKYCIGYAQLDLTDPESKIVFGTWNPRQLSSTEVAKLHKSFEDNGIQIDNNPITVLIDPKIINVNNLAEKNEAFNTPKIEFTVPSPQRAVYATSGQHRKAALQQYVSAAKKESAAAEKQLSAAQKKNSPTNEIKTTIENLQRKMKAGHWVVTVLDHGKLVPIYPRERALIHRDLISYPSNKLCAYVHVYVCAHAR